MDKGKEIAKSIVAFLTALGTWGATAAADGQYTQEELWGLCGVVVVGLATWAVPNHVAIRSSKRDSWADPLTTDR